MILELSEDSAIDKNLKQAIKIANRFLKTEMVNLVLRSHFKVDFFLAQAKLNSLSITYSIQVKDEDDNDHFAWTERSLEANVIHINDIFRKRLGHVQSKDGHGSKEAKIIVVYMSILIIHELSHLLLRWKGYMYSPGDFGEAGNYLEIRMFGGVSLILTHEENFVWDESSKYAGIAIEHLLGTGQKEVRRVSYRDYIEKIFHMSLVGESYVQPVLLEGKIPKGVIARKQLDEEDTEEDSESSRRLAEEEIGPFTVLDFNPKILKCPFMKRSKF